MDTYFQLPLTKNLLSCLASQSCRVSPQNHVDILVALGKYSMVVIMMMSKDEIDISS